MNKYNINIEEYRHVWQNNIQIIEGLTKNLEKQILRLENKTSTIEEIFNKIKEKLMVLSTIYSNFNNIEGGDYILKLKAIITEIDRRLQTNNYQMNTVYFILNRVMELQKESFDNFPFFNHTLPSEENQTIRDINNTESAKLKESSTLTVKKSYPYKWVTFKRNNSHIILPYKSMVIIPYKSIKFVTTPESPLEQVEYRNRKYYVTDLFLSKLKEKYIKPAYYIISKGNCFAADSIERRYLSKKNIFKANVEQINIKNNFIKGKIRIKGINHYYLKG